MFGLTLEAIAFLAYFSLLGGALLTIYLARYRGAKTLDCESMQFERMIIGAKKK